MLELRAMATANTEAHTDVAPLMPHSQGVNAADLPDAAFMPMGKAMPMKKPKGKRTATAMRIRSGVVLPRKPLTAWGVRMPKTMSMPRRRDMRIIEETPPPERLIFCVE